MEFQLVNNAGLACGGLERLEVRGLLVRRVGEVVEVLAVVGVEAVSVGVAVFVLRHHLRRRRLEERVRGDVELARGGVTPISRVVRRVRSRRWFRRRWSRRRRVLGGGRR